MTEPIRPDRPGNNLEPRLARFFGSEVARARTDLRRRPLGRRPAMVTRFAPPVSLAAAAVAVIVAALLLRPTGGSEAPGTWASDSHAGGPTSGSLSSDSPTSSSPPPAEDWSLITWSMAPTELFGGRGNQFLTDVTAWRAGFVAVGVECCGTPTTGIVWSSPDGKSWRRMPDPVRTFADASIESVLAAGDRLVAVGQIADTTVVWVSQDGIRWDPGGSPEAFAGGHVAGMTSGPAGLIAYGWESQSRKPVMWSSTDGLSWEQLPVTFEGDLNGVFVSGTPLGYLATGAQTWWSTDGRQWEQAMVEDDARLGGIVGGAEGMIATGSTAPLRSPGELSGPIVLPEYWHSVDGRNWRRLRPAGEQPPTFGDQLTTDGSTIVAIGHTREIWTSRDGLTWHKLVVAADPTVDPSRSNLTNFRHLAIGPAGIVATDDAPVVGTEEDLDQAVWFGAATSGPIPEPLATLPLVHNDGRNDARCIGGEGGDPGVVCIPLGYYLRNESSRDRVVRLSGPVDAVLAVPAGSVGRLTEIGPVWDSGKPVVVELLSSGCQVVQRLTPTGDLALIVIGVDDTARIDSPPPPVPLPETQFAASGMCRGP